MNFISGDYLRVTSVQTEDGSRPKLDENGRQMYKETELPLTAKKYMEKRNELLPNHLKMKIEIVKSIQDGTEQQPVAQGTTGRDISPDMLKRKRFSMVGGQHLVRK